METRAHFLPRTRPKSPPVLRDRRSPRRHPRVGDTVVIIGRVRTQGREPSSSGHFINLDFTEGERCLSAGRRVPKTTVVRTLAIGRTPTGSSMRQDVKQISVGISDRRPGMPAYGTTSASHLSLALRVFSLEEAIVVCSFIPPNPPTLLPRYVLPAPCTMHPLRSSPSPVIGYPSPGLRLAPIQTRTSTPVSTRAGVRCRVAPHRKFPCGVPAERSSKTLGPITTGPGPKLGYHIWEESLLGSSLHL